jgi:hypothetical protein
MELKLLTQMQTVKEEHIDRQAKEIKKRQMERENETKYVNNSGQTYRKNDNKL